MKPTALVVFSLVWAFVPLLLFVVGPIVGAWLLRRILGR